MAIPIEDANMKASRFVIPTSRYINSKVIYWGPLKKLTFTTYKRKSLKPAPSDKYYILEKVYEFRPDKLSKKVFGTEDFWWKLLEANNMKDIYDFKAGVNIRIPGGIF